MSNVKFPFGDAKTVTITDAATSTITIEDAYTIVSAGTISQAITALSLTAGDDLNVGSRVTFDVLQGATGRNITFGSAGDTIVAPVLTGVANDRDTIDLVWNGSEFVANAAAWAKIVDAA